MLAQLHTKHPRLVEAEHAIRKSLHALMLVCTRTTPHVACSGERSEEDVEEAFRDDDKATPRVSTVRRSCGRVLFRLLAVDLMVRHV